MVERPRWRGSGDEFDRQWRESLKGDLDRWLIYPESCPNTQTALDENMKAQQITALLAQYNQKKGRVLEFGCGAAGMSIYLANHGFFAVGCDVSINALRVAQRNADRHLVSVNKDSFHVSAGDVASLPFGNASFNLVMSYGLLEHFSVEYLEGILEDVLRVLAPGGVFIADIIPGRFTVRTIGVWISLVISWIFHLITFQWKQLKSLTKAYLDQYYENSLGPEDWSSLLIRMGLKNVNVQVCRPFPPLAISGGAERVYTHFLKALIPFWRWYDRTQSTWGRNWGWMYLVWGVRQQNED